MSGTGPRAPFDAAVGAPARRALLVLARAAVEAAVRGTPLDPALLRAAPALPVHGAFVTLTKDGALRGCIGTVGREGPANELVASSGRSAALSDPRFPAVTPAELGALHIEVSLLSPLEPVDTAVLPGAIVPGEHGVVVEQGSSRGLFLPQVAPEQGWDAVRLLDEVCRKAWLPREAWRQAARVSRFTALVLAEEPRR